MSKKESLIVQLIYLSPNPRHPDFCLRQIDSMLLSKSFPSILRLVTYLENDEAEHSLAAKGKDNPWSQSPDDEDLSVSENCALVRAIVWTAGASGLSTAALDTLAHAAPAGIDQQPKNSFWVVDLQSRRVLSSGEDFDVARSRFHGMVNRIRDQI